VHLFSMDGFSLWDNNWYAGHYLPGYSLLFPALATLVGLQAVGVASVVLSTLAFRALAMAHFGSRASRATALFALSACGDLFIGRLTFALGVAFGVSSVLAVVNGHRKLTVLLSLACAAASPVAALFLALVAMTDVLSNRALGRALTLAGPGLALTLTIAVLFPEGGYETFALTSLAAAAGFSAVLLFVLPARERLLRRGVALYLVALGLAYFVRSPMGSNSVRLGVLFVPAIWGGVVGVGEIRLALSRAVGWWPLRRATHRDHTAALGPRLARFLLGGVGLGLVLWQLDGPLLQAVEASNEPSTQLSYYAPVIRYLDSQSHGAPMRIEEAFTRSHWDAVILGRRFALARGWERQLDMKYDGLFYAPALTASAYHAWLASTAVRFVVLSDAPLDYSSHQEAALIRREPSFLRPVFSSAHWRVYEVLGAEPLLSGPGRLSAMDDDGFTLQARRAGVFVVRVRYTRYWRIASGLGTVGEAQNGWTQVRVDRPGKVVLDAEL
jgi:hypothetical protein